MRIGFVGLGKMGGNMVTRLLRDRHEVVVYNRSRPPIEKAVKSGAEGASSLGDLVSRLPDKKAVWLMVPSGDPVDDNIAGLSEHLKAGDIIVDGGNSRWTDSRRRSETLLEKGINLVDCGTSGGVWGLENGYCLMYGGEPKSCRHLEPVFKSLAPDNGYLYCGPGGSGHFVKMVHNGIEYGMMQSYAEGFEIMKASPYDIDLRAVSKVWQYGSVVRSWLLELAERAFTEDPGLEKLQAFVQDSGEGRWTVDAAIDFDVPAPVIANALFARFYSRDKDSFAMKVLAALRNQFGGHAVREKDTGG